MGMTHAGFEFTGRFGTIAEGPIAQPHQRLSFPGVIGTSILVGVRKDRQLQCQYTIDGQDSMATLQAVLNSIHARQGYSGTLTVTGTAAVSYDNCLFLGFQPQGPPQYSAGGVEGWMIDGRLVWTQYLIE